MSTKEIAYSILEQFTDEELEAFVTLFSRVCRSKTDSNDHAKHDEAFFEEI